MENCWWVTDRLLGNVVLQEMLKATLTVRVFFMLLGPDFELDATYYNYEKAPNPEVQRFYDMLNRLKCDSHLNGGLKVHDKYTYGGEKKYTWTYDPFILSQQDEQVTYVPYPTPK
ncbi:hypothetical protein M9H77_31056 [Catharanthus roseus]|uniref:Uncharacterized protein n=1 Tax=Catharanthus roseus TaxID=4058 RepID=A0ACB9ZZV1_CATRO|nr:hypothetical protein M9H77_31056 [Catharanthus roseus]